MQLEINGQIHSDVAATAVTGLVAYLGLEPKTVLIEHNGKALLRSEWAQAELADGDRIEILQVAAGG